MQHLEFYFHELEKIFYMSVEHIHCLEGHVLLSGLTLVKHSFTYVLLKFYVLVHHAVN